MAWSFSSRTTAACWRSCAAIGRSSSFVIANLSRFTQYVELDLSAYRGLAVVELFGRTAFPPIDERPYVLTLAPYAFHWFALEPPLGAAVPSPTRRVTSSIPVVTAPTPWAAVLRGDTSAQLDEVLLRYLRRCRWFGGQGERILSMTRVEGIAVTEEPTPAYLTMYQIEYAERDPEIYVLPLAVAEGARGGAAAALPAGCHRPPSPARLWRWSRWGALRRDVESALHP